MEYSDFDSQGDASWQWQISTSQPTSLIARLVAWLGDFRTLNELAWGSARLSIKALLVAPVMYKG